MMGITPAPTERSATASGLFSSSRFGAELLSGGDKEDGESITCDRKNGQKPAKISMKSRGNCCA